MITIRTIVFIRRAHEIRIGELIIIKNRNFNIDHNLLFTIRREVYRNNFSWKQWNINYVEDHIDELVIDYNRFLTIKQRDEYNWNK